MSKKPNKDDETANKDDNPEETDEKGAERVIRVIHELITGNGEGETQDNPPTDNPTDNPPAKDGEGGEGGEGEVDEALQASQKAIEKAEEERKGLLKKVTGLEKRLKTYEKKEETVMVKEIEGVIADLRQSAEDKKTYAEELKKAQDELKTVKDKLGERETQLGAIATKAFEEEKKILVDAVRKDFEKTLGADEAEKKAKEVEEKITTPTQLEEVKGWMGVFMKAMEEGSGETEGEGKGKDEGEGTIYSGKGQDLSKTGGVAKAPPKDVKGEYAEARDVIAALYDAYEEELFNKQFTPDKYNRARHLEAQKKLNTVWQNIVKGVKARGGKVISGEFDVRACQYCKKTFFGDKAICPYCGKPVQAHERGKSELYARRGR